MSVDVLNEIRCRVEKIREAAGSGDFETAHAFEDELFLDVLRYVAHSRKNALSSVAAEALKSNEIKFHRWCA